jgi:NADPH:quinone reductase-like Zn-dependent oxidoreductase
MRAIVYDRYGSPAVLRVQEVDKPAVRDGEVLVRVHAVSVNPADWHFLTGTPYLMRVGTGLSKPKGRVLGLDFAGRVEEVGANVSGLQPGDEVFGAHTGAFAEYVSAPENSMAPKPANLSFEEAAAVPVAGVTALQGLRDKGKLQAGQRVLIIGASGGVGTFAVQVAKSLGAEVTGVCSTRNVERVRSLGADRVIDYTSEDFAGDGARYDLVFVLAGHSSGSELLRVLNPKGTLLLCSGDGGGPWLGPFIGVTRTLARSAFASQRAVMWIANSNRADLLDLKALIEAEKVTPVLDKRYALADAAEAFRYQGEGHTQGKSVLTV